MSKRQSRPLCPVIKQKYTTKSDDNINISSFEQEYNEFIQNQLQLYNNTNDNNYLKPDEQSKNLLDLKDELFLAIETIFNKYINK